MVQGPLCVFISCGNALPVVEHVHELDITVLCTIVFRSFVACLPHRFLQAEVQQMGQLLTIDVTQTHWKPKQTSLPASLGFGQTPCCYSFG